MKVQVLYFNGCPNHESTVHLAREVARELGLGVNVEEVEVTSAEDAARLRFLGSPSVQVNGIDIEPDARASSDYALACRTYSGHGVPPREFLVKALKEGSSGERDPVSCEGRSACDSKDLVNRRVGWLLWGLPVAGLATGALLAPAPRTAVWTAAFLVAGVSCVVNARRCGRLHCYFTGPLYLLAAAATLLLGVGGLPIGWNSIAVVAIVGTLLAYVPEWVRGRYPESAAAELVK